jgi:hypothetical protein
MADDKITIKSINFRGGNTIVRYTETCECGCTEKAYLKYWPSKKVLAESTILSKIKESTPAKEVKPATNED